MQKIYMLTLLALALLGGVTIMTTLIAPPASAAFS
jgi:hypothetical protein